MNSLQLIVTFTILLQCLLGFVNGMSLRSRENENSVEQVACCDDSCRSAICIPPWVSICSQCKEKRFERMEIRPNAEPEVAEKPEPDRKDCCNNKCKTAICVPPFAFICAGCTDHLDILPSEKARVEPAQESVVDVVVDDMPKVPYKHCCDQTCKTQLCVPPFVAICMGCEKSMSSPLLSTF